jgi:hypothetical protein
MVALRPRQAVPSDIASNVNNSEDDRDEDEDVAVASNKDSVPTVPTVPPTQVSLTSPSGFVPEKLNASRFKEAKVVLIKRPTLKSGRSLTRQTFGHNER